MLDLEAFELKFSEVFCREYDKGQPDEKDDLWLYNITEKAMLEAGFDPALDAEQVMDDYIMENQRQLQEAFMENEEKAFDIYRAAGLDEVKIKWRRFEQAHLTRSQERQIRRIADEMENLGDLQFSLVLMRGVVLKHRPDLKEKYKDFDLYLTER